MTMTVSSFLRAAAVALIVQQVALAQKCYYPNGREAAGEKPCSSAEGSACCPDKWECMDNGLCYYDPDKLWGRYSCTDEDWESEGCPSNLCTYDMNAAGAEAVTQCSNHDDQWCCNADRVNVNCCQESPEPRPFFALQDGVAYGTAGSRTGSTAPNLASITGKAVGGDDDDDSPSSTAPPSTSTSASATKDSVPSTSASATDPPPPPVTSVSTTVSTGTAGPTTLIITTTLQPAASSTSTATDSPTPSSESTSNIPLIVGCAVGIPLGLALVAILAWLLRKRSHQKRTPPYSETPDPYTTGSASPDFAGNAKLHSNANGGSGTAAKYEAPDPNVPELGGGQGVGPERPVSMIPGKAEMDSGGGFAPGTTPLAPHLVGVGGGNGHAPAPQDSWGSAPPGYSPDANHTHWAPGHAQQPSADGAAWGGAAGYIPYRPPPPGHGAMGGPHNNVPEMAELDGGPSPPAVAELGNPSPPAAGNANTGPSYPGMG